MSTDTFIYTKKAEFYTFKILEKGSHEVFHRQNVCTNNNMTFM